MDTFLKIWESVDGSGKFFIGLGIFLLIAMPVWAVSDALTSWSGTRWPGPKRNFDDDDEGDDE